MEQKFYIAIDGQPAGPFTIEELKSKKIQRETLVWTDGLDNWTKAENIPILKDILRGIPPPLPNTEANTTSPKIPSIQTLPPPISNNKYFGYELALRRERLFAAIIEDIFEDVIISVLILLSGRDVFNDDLYSLYSFDSIVSNMILSAIFGAIFYSMWGGNLGHKIVGLAVISAQNGEIQNKAITGAVREALKSVFSLAFIPVLWLLWDDDKQNLYDKVVKTYVVKKKKSRRDK
jgi:uncharacterized RDD family membrane protein YckC